MKLSTIAVALLTAALAASPVEAQDKKDGFDAPKKIRKKADAQGKSPVKRQNTPEKQAAQKKAEAQKKKPFIERKKD